MRKPYQAYSQQDWQQIMNQYAASGLTQKAFCQQEGLVPGTFSKWRKQLGLVHSKPLAKETGVDFKPLTAVSLSAPESQQDATSRADGWAVELVFGW